MMACFCSGRFPKISDLQSREEVRMVPGNDGNGIFRTTLVS